jgi:hypothetical protein
MLFNEEKVEEIREKAADLINKVKMIFEGQYYENHKHPARI